MKPKTVNSLLLLSWVFLGGASNLLVCLFVLFQERTQINFLPFFAIPQT